MNDKYKNLLLLDFFCLVSLYFHRKGYTKRQVSQTSNSIKVTHTHLYMKWGLEKFLTWSRGYLKNSCFWSFWRMIKTFLVYMYVYIFIQFSSLLLNWLPPKVEDPSLPFYFTYRKKGWSICAKENVRNSTGIQTQFMLVLCSKLLTITQPTHTHTYISYYKWKILRCFYFLHYHLYVLFVQSIVSFCNDNYKHFSWYLKYVQMR